MSPCHTAAVSPCVRAWHGNPRTCKWGNGFGFFMEMMVVHDPGAFVVNINYNDSLILLV